MAEDGTFQIRKGGGSGELNVLLALTFKDTHEIQGGATIVSAKVEVLLNGQPSTDFLLTNQAIDPTGKEVQVRVSDNGSVVGRKYFLLFTVTLSDTSDLMGSILIYPVLMDQVP